jgi:hypothetical protein
MICKNRTMKAFSGRIPRPHRLPNLCTKQLQSPREWQDKKQLSTLARLGVSVRVNTSLSGKWDGLASQDTKNSVLHGCLIIDIQVRFLELACFCKTHVRIARVWGRPDCQWLGPQLWFLQIKLLQWDLQPDQRLIE